MILDNHLAAKNEEGRKRWDQKADFWDALHGEEGNSFHRQLISPAVEALLQLQAGERVLDVACGSGVMARRLASLGAEITATDYSAGLIKRAKARGQSAGLPIRYMQVDATDEAALLALGEGQYDAIVCTMALMDMPVISPLYRAVRRLLRPNGRFVFATAHPAFNSSNPSFIAEMSDENGDLQTRYTLRIGAYLDIPPTLATGAAGEPAAHFYYHRPLHELLGEAFRAGLVLDGMEEPAYPQEETDDGQLSWRRLWQIPPVMAARLCIANSA